MFLYVYAFNQERKKDPYYEDVGRPFEGIAAIGRRNVVYPRDPLDTTRLLVKSFSTKEWVKIFIEDARSVGLTIA